MGLKVGIVRGPKHLTDEEIDKQIMNEIYSVCVGSGITELDFKLFKEKIIQLMNTKEATVHQILVFYNSLFIDDKAKILRECAVSRKEAKPRLSNFEIDFKDDYIEPNIKHKSKQAQYNEYIDKIMSKKGKHKR
jgi:hypothetical protein